MFETKEKETLVPWHKFDDVLFAFVDAEFVLTALGKAFYQSHLEEMDDEILRLLDGELVTLFELKTEERPKAFEIVDENRNTILEGTGRKLQASPSLFGKNYWLYLDGEPSYELTAHHWVDSLNEFRHVH